MYSPHDPWSSDDDYDMPDDDHGDVKGDTKNEVKLPFNVLQFLRWILVDKMNPPFILWCKVYSVKNFYLISVSLCIDCCKALNWMVDHVESQMNMRDFSSVKSEVEVSLL